jgi:hypothetical protein
MRAIPLPPPEPTAAKLRRLEERNRKLSEAVRDILWRVNDKVACMRPLEVIRSVSIIADEALTEDVE